MICFQLQLYHFNSEVIYKPTGVVWITFAKDA